MVYDWIQVFSTAFLLVFAAEFGDKTQIAIFTLASQSGRKLLIFVGAVSALTAVNLIGISVGTAFTHILSTASIRWVAGCLFIAFGLVMLMGNLEERLKVKTVGSNLLLITFTSISLMELGDKTQLASIGLVAKYPQPLLVLSAVALAFTGTTAIALAWGHLLYKRLPYKLVRAISSFLFITFGALTLLGY